MLYIYNCGCIHIYQHIYTYGCIYVYVVIYAHIYVYTCVHAYTHIHAQMFWHMYIHTYAWYLSFIVPIYTYPHHLEHVPPSLIHTCVNLRVSICRAYVALCLFFRCSLPSFAAPQRAAVLCFKEESRARGSGSAAASLSCSREQSFCGTLRRNMGRCEIWGAFYESSSLVLPCVLIFFWLKRMHICTYAYMFTCKCTYT